MESTYKIKNQTKEDYVLYLDHPKNGGYKLTDDSTKAEEELDNDYRFKVKVSSGKTEEFKVQERTEVSNTVYIAQMSPEQIEVYLTQPQLSAKAKKFLEEVVKVKTEMTKTQREYNGLNKERQQLESDEGRYRSNINVLGSSPKERTLREKYVEQLDKLDNRLGELRVSMQEKEGSIRELETKLAEMVQEFKE
ncbi:MAG: hypothetical protein A2W23_07500 [Planctomycetes bacterium RBG_16_43_13]|nr:MAG: hypothetical protein A2W23_07500 [Planctomycetes bacterium RBG_16_43_13]